MTQTNPITLIQFFETDSDHLQTVVNNSNLLKKIGVEYIVFDISNSGNLISKLQKIDSFRSKEMLYIHKANLNIKSSYIQGLDIASFDKIYFISENIILNEENLQEVDTTCPKLLKSERNEFIKSVPEDFRPENFHLHMKKNKSFFEKLKIKFLI